jgi:transposase
MVTVFLTAEGSSPTENHRRLKRMYREDATDISGIRCWVRRFKSGEKETGGRPRSGRPASTATTETKEKVDALIRDDGRITSALCAATGIGKPVLMTIIRELGYREVCARWVLKMFTVELNKQPEKHLCTTSPAQ